MDFVNITTMTRYCFVCGRQFLINGRFCSECGTAKRIENENDEVVQNINDNIDDVIKCYFRKGMKYKTIIVLLRDYHDVEWSLSKLKRHLREKGLKRKRKNPIDEPTRRIIEREAQNSNGIKGYRSIWHKLKICHGISTNRDDVMKALREINPEQSQGRKARKLNRRTYCSPGPNAAWHADGYDKLKPYGFPIHGCIDGFSRKVL